MSVAGNIYGVVLNDAVELEQLSPQLGEKPYLAPPRAPVVYMKPLSSLARGPVELPGAGDGLTAATTLAVLISRDTGGVNEADIADCIGGVALALDLSIPASSYYRPAVAQKNGDGRLVLGRFVSPAWPKAITLRARGTLLHEWQLDRLVRPVSALIRDLGTFMTLRAGDVLLLGLPGDAPTLTQAAGLRVEADGMPALDMDLVEEPA